MGKWIVAVTEEMIETINLPCINNGRGTRLDIKRNKMSCNDLRLVCTNKMSLCEWKKCDVYRDSDHFSHYMYNKYW